MEGQKKKVTISHNFITFDTPANSRRHKIIYITFSHQSISYLISDISNLKSTSSVNMGKASRNKTKHRADPTSKTVKPPTDPELAAIRVNKILPILQDLQSADQSKRSAAATVIANLADDPKCRKLFLREKIVQILLEQTLTDSSMETRIAGWGTMRNLALEEEADFCVHLYRQDILTAIEGAIKSVRTYNYRNTSKHILTSLDH